MLGSHKGSLEDPPVVCFLAEVVLSGHYKTSWPHITPFLHGMVGTIWDISRLFFKTLTNFFVEDGKFRARCAWFLVPPCVGCCCFMEKFVFKALCVLFFSRPFPLRCVRFCYACDRLIAI